MADYFEEMSWRPLEDGEAPNHLIHFARLLQEFSIFNDTLPTEWPSLPPPTSKAAIEQLINIEIKEEDQKCPICLKQHAIKESVKNLPCNHKFHPDCILPWLNKTNSCPVCRYEFPTDDEGYEEFKKMKKRAKEREDDLDTLHNSMFG